MVIVFWSSSSGHTKAFVHKLGLECYELKDYDPSLGSFILCVPTYGSGSNSGTLVRPVLEFLRIKECRDQCRGVIGTGNTNFGDLYCIGGKRISAKLQVPYLGSVELRGTEQDVEQMQRNIRYVSEENEDNT